MSVRRRAARMPPRERLAHLAQVFKGADPRYLYEGELTHDFAPGVYLRTLKLKAGSSIVSEIHKTEHFLLIHYGTVRIVDQNGENIVHDGRTMLRTMPGTQRAYVVINDTELTTIHANPDDCRDLDVIRERVVAKDWDEVDEIIGKMIDAHKKAAELPYVVD